MDWTLVKSKLLDEIYLGCKFDKNSEIREVLETPEMIRSRIRDPIVQMVIRNPPIHVLGIIGFYT